MTKSVIPAAIMALAALIGVPANATAQQKMPTQEEFLAMFIAQKTELSAKPVKLHGTMFFLVETKVNGVPAKMLIDTGASHTTLDLGWVKKAFPQARVMFAPVGNGGDPYAFSQTNLPLMPIDNLSVGENKFSEFLIPLVDLSGLRNALPELNDVVGVLGMNTLGAAPCRITFKTRTLQWLDKAGVEKIGKKERLQTLQRQGTNCLMVNIFSPKDGKPLSALLDCGAVVSCVPEAFWTGALPEKQTMPITTAKGTQLMEVSFGVPAAMKLTPNFSVKICPQLLPENAAPKYLLGSDVLSQTDLLLDAAGNAAFVILPE